MKNRFFNQLQDTNNELAYDPDAQLNSELCEDNPNEGGAAVASDLSRALAAKLAVQRVDGVEARVISFSPVHQNSNGSKLPERFCLLEVLRPSDEELKPYRRKLSDGHVSSGWGNYMHEVTKLVLTRLDYVYDKAGISVKHDSISGLLSPDQGYDSSLKWFVFWEGSEANDYFGCPEDYFLVRGASLGEAHQTFLELYDKHMNAVTEDRLGPVPHYDVDPNRVNGFEVTPVMMIP